MKLFMNLWERVTDPSRSLRERIAIVLTGASLSIAIVALIGDVIYGEYIGELIALVLTIIVAPLMVSWGVRSGKVNLATELVSLGVIFGVVPSIFFFGGGPEGGAVPWMVFGYIYIGLVLSGVWRTACLLLLTAVVLVLFNICYYFPHLIHSHSRELFFIDSALGVIEVGFVCFIMAWFQNLLSKQESKRAWDETKKVEDLSRAQSRFFSSMSHEIRTPINSILGLNEIILRQEDASQEIIRDAGNIQGAGRMLLALVNDILDFSKIEAGKMDIVPVNYNMAALVSEIVNMMWMRAQEKGLELKIEVDPSIPAELFGDEVRIKQILINLLNNAVKYTKEGLVTLHIAKEDTDEDRILLMFSVSDTGIGIKQDALPYLFDAFKRVDEEKTNKIEGTGLGLSIVKQLVELMDGRITVNSVYTQGSTFVVTLWQKVTRQEPIGEINITNLGFAEGGSKYEAGFTAPDVRILIVDDNEMNLEVEKKLLDGTEMTIDIAKSGEEAISLSLANKYDIILMDHLMPQMDGIECMQHIRKQQGGLNNFVPIIVLTANAGSENRSLYNRSGFNGCLVKPVSGRQLEEMLLEHLPELKVNLNPAAAIEKSQMNTARAYNKKIPVLITTSSMCDLPLAILREFQIDTIPFSIHMGGKVYYDSYEADTNELVRYMKEGEPFDSEPPTVEEFEKFFGMEMKKAHQVIHITISTSISAEYNNAREAARAYGNVRVFNSENNSAAMGLLVLMAVRMANQGLTVENILSELKNARRFVQCSFMTDSTDFMMKKGFIGNGVFRIMHTLGLRPFIRIKNDRFMIEKIILGERRKCHTRYIEHCLAKASDVDRNTLFVVYVDMSEEDLEYIESTIRNKCDFNHIVFQKASAVMSLNCGSGAFGLLFLKKGAGTYDLGSMFREDEETLTQTVEPDNDSVTWQESYDMYVHDEADKKEDAWYEKIEGIDPYVAIDNSGSEEAFRTVLKIFHESIDERADELQEFYDREDFENYTIKVHALKSSAKLVGALQLSEDARLLEMAGKEGDIDFIRLHHADAMEELRSYIEPIGRAIADLEQSEAAENDVPDDVNANFDRYLIESVYDAIRMGVNTQDDDIIRATLGEVADYAVPEADRFKFNRIGECLEKGDYDGIMAVIDG